MIKRTRNLGAGLGCASGSCADLASAASSFTAQSAAVPHCLSASAPQLAKHAGGDADCAGKTCSTSSKRTIARAQATLPGSNQTMPSALCELDQVAESVSQSPASSTR